MSDFLKNGCLQDEAILKALDEAKELYEDGAIIECRDILAEIITAVDDFEG